MRRWWPLVLVSTVACLPSFEDECGDERPCAQGRVCLSGVCVLRGLDGDGAAPDDAGTDGTIADGAAIDGAIIDGSIVDATLSDEVCNGQDDDRDGVSDEGELCPDEDDLPGICLAGRCVYTCPDGVFDRDSNPANGCQRGCDARGSTSSLVGAISLDEQRLALAVEDAVTVVAYRAPAGPTGRGVRVYVKDEVSRTFAMVEDALGTFGAPSVALFDQQIIMAAGVRDGAGDFTGATVGVVRETGAARNFIGLSAPTDGGVEFTAIARSGDRIAVIGDQAQPGSGLSAPIAWVTEPSAEARDGEMVAVGALLPSPDAPPVALGRAGGFAVLRTSPALGGLGGRLVDQRFSNMPASGAQSGRALDDPPTGPLTASPSGQWALPFGDLILSGRAGETPDLEAASLIPSPAANIDPTVVDLPGGWAWVYGEDDAVKIAFPEGENWHIETLTTETGGVVEAVTAGTVEDELRVAWLLPDGDTATLRFASRRCY